MAENIYPIFEKMLQRKDREALLKQKGIISGLPDCPVPVKAH